MINRTSTGLVLFASTLLVYTVGCCGQGCESEPQKSYGTLLKDAVAAEPRKVDASTTLDKVFADNKKRLEFRYTVTDAGKAAAVSNHGASFQKIVTSMTSSDPLAKEAAFRKVTIEHIFNDESGSLISSIVADDHSPQSGMPMAAEVLRNKVNTTGVQGNPFLK
ncbi:hypothetical protein [Rubripirellula reticaptiva]|uniref:Uncharacterized protein n=1 Tax=Rubripirellula reticaptiva TaxID=2528013 RepID=A0A5C6FD19_9BACT|nr:hypothetical protein [Rubripirellula reticaptiva]TWU57491.1 hypothetical protein Poly59_03980 [Rubripirellula reticaptiva]